MVLGKEILVQRKNVGEEMRFENFNLSKKRSSKKFGLKNISVKEIF